MPEPRAQPGSTAQVGIGGELVLVGPQSGWACRGGVITGTGNGVDSVASSRLGPVGTGANAPGALSCEELLAVVEQQARMIGTPAGGAQPGDPPPMAGQRLATRFERAA